MIRTTSQERSTTVSSYFPARAAVPHPERRFRAMTSRNDELVTTYVRSASSSRSRHLAIASPTHPPRSDLPLAPEKHALPATLPAALVHGRKPRVVLRLGVPADAEMPGRAGGDSGVRRRRCRHREEVVFPLGRGRNIGIVVQFRQQFLDLNLPLKASVTVAEPRMCRLIDSDTDGSPDVLMPVPLVDLAEISLNPLVPLFAPPPVLRQAEDV